ncbi:MAG: hypothetical protein AAF670_13060 [Planctomycetota bacterium]
MTRYTMTTILYQHKRQRASRACMRATMLLVMLTSVSSVQAFHGERIVSSQVISDTVVGGEVTAGCPNGDCGDSVVEGDVMGGVNSRTHYGQPDLFYNYYTQGQMSSANAQMYISPVPVPPHVGQTFMTYQPLYPHEMLYRHTNRFHNYYDDGRGLNRTRVQYSFPPVRRAASNFYWNKLRIPR